jgi:hypothetical protein
VSKRVRNTIWLRIRKYLRDKSSNRRIYFGSIIVVLHDGEVGGVEIRYSKRVLARTMDWAQTAVFLTFIFYTTTLEINAFETAHEIPCLDTSSIFVRMYLIYMRGKETSKLFTDKIYMLLSICSIPAKGFFRITSPWTGLKQLGLFTLKCVFSTTFRLVRKKVARLYRKISRLWTKCLGVL